MSAGALSVQEPCELVIIDHVQLNEDSEPPKLTASRQWKRSEGKE